MQRTSRIAAAAVIVASLAASSSATASSPPPIPVTCGASPNQVSATLTVPSISSASFVITMPDGTTQKYVLTTITSSFMGSPVTKTYGQKTGQTAGSIECTGTLDGGTFDATGVTAS